MVQAPPNYLRNYFGARALTAPSKYRPSPLYLYRSRPFRPHPLKPYCTPGLRPLYRKIHQPTFLARIRFETPYRLAALTAWTIRQMLTRPRYFAARQSYILHRNYFILNLIPHRHTATRHKFNLPQYPTMRSMKPHIYQPTPPVLHTKPKRPALYMVRYRLLRYRFPVFRMQNDRKIPGPQRRKIPRVRMSYLRTPHRWKVDRSVFIAHTHQIPRRRTYHPMTLSPRLKLPKTYRIQKVLQRQFFRLDYPNLVWLTHRRVTPSKPMTHPAHRAIRLIRRYTKYRIPTITNIMQTLTFNLIPKHSTKTTTCRTLQRNTPNRRYSNPFMLTLETYRRPTQMRTIPLLPFT